MDNSSGKNWKTIALCCVLFTGGGLGGYQINGQNGHDAELVRRIELNSTAVDVNRRSIQKIAIDLAEIKNDVSNVHARIDDWSLKWEKDVDRLERKMDRLEELIIRQLEDH